MGAVTPDSFHMVEKKDSGSIPFHSFAQLTIHFEAFTTNA